MKLTTLFPTASTCWIFALLSGCGLGSGDSADYVMDPRVDGMLEAHNEVRANVQPAASPPLEPMTWSPKLAIAAQEHGEKCIWEHSTDLGALNQGENLAAYAPAGEPAERPVIDWAAEVSMYDYPTNGCTGVCGHYTQIVWRESLEVGCAVVDCPNGLDGFPEGREIWVCRYAPAGNYIGEQPY